MNKLKLTIGLGFLANILHAQSSNSNDNLLFYGMVAVSAVLLFGLCWP